MHMLVGDIASSSLSQYITNLNDCVSIAKSLKIPVSETPSVVPYTAKLTYIGLAKRPRRFGDTSVEKRSIRVR